MTGVMGFSSEFFECHIITFPFFTTFSSLLSGGVELVLTQTIFNEPLLLVARGVPHSEAKGYSSPIKILNAEEIEGMRLACKVRLL